MAEVPIVVGSAGLIGRPQWHTRELALEDLDAPREDRQPKALPSSCLRVLNSPLGVDRGGGCPTECAGRQPDGGCLCEIVRAANAQGVDWKFEIDRATGFWEYVGPELEQA